MTKLLGKKQNMCLNNILGHKYDLLRSSYQRIEASLWRAAAIPVAAITTSTTKREKLELKSRNVASHLSFSSKTKTPTATVTTKYATTAPKITDTTQGSSYQKSFNNSCSTQGSSYQKSFTSCSTQDSDY